MMCKIKHEFVLFKNTLTQKLSAIFLMKTSSSSHYFFKKTMEPDSIDIAFFRLPEKTVHGRMCLCGCHTAVRTACAKNALCRRTGNGHDLKRSFSLRSCFDLLGCDRVLEGVRIQLIQCFPPDLPVRIHEVRDLGPRVRQNNIVGGIVGKPIHFPSTE